MSDVPDPPVQPPEGLPEPQPETPVVRRRRGPSLVWVVPLLAAAIGAWLWFDTLRSRGPEITIEFASAEGLEAGRTRIKFKSVDVGLVESVQIKPDLSAVVVTAQMQRGTESLLKAGSRFWVVRPRFGLAGVSGLATLLSGAYIAVEPGDTGPAVDRFVGVEEPPQVPAERGLKLRLHADALGSLDTGAPVLYRGVSVGTVEGYRLSDSRPGLEIDIHVDNRHAARVRSNTRFWNTSGLDVTFGPDGLRLTAGSLASLLSGAIEFDVPPGEDAGAPARSGDTFRLYRHRAEAEGDEPGAQEFALYFSSSVRGLSPGAAVEYRGMRLGTVRDVELQDRPLEEALTRVTVGLDSQRLVSDLPGELDEDARRLALIDRGLRARLMAGSLLTGALIVELVMAPDQEARLHGAEGEHELPTISSTTDELRAAVDDLPKLIADARSAVASIADLARSLESQSSLQVRLGTALDEITQAMRSIRELADLLEHQPDALLWGRDEEKRR